MGSSLSDTASGWPGRERSGDEGPELGGEGGIEVTEEEKAAIERLASMGFDKGLAIEAFFACDKNETLAANYLIEHAAEFND